MKNRQNPEQLTSKSTGESLPPVNPTHIVNSLDEHGLVTCFNSAQAQDLDGRLTFINGCWAQEIRLHAFDGTELKQSCREAPLSPGLILGVLLQGELQFALNNKAFRIQAHQQPVLFAYRLTSEALFRKTLLGGQRVRKLILTLPECALAKLGELPTPLQSHAQPVSRPSPTSITELAEKVLQHTGLQEPQHHMMRDAMWLELIAQAIHGLTSAPIAAHTQHANRIRKRLDFLIHQHEDELTLEELARFFNMSVSKMQRLFKTEFKQTINDYIRQTRLERAHKAMLEHNLSIGEAAYLAGYRHTSNFTAAYKKQYGVTPGSLFKPTDTVG